MHRIVRVSPLLLLLSMSGLTIPGQAGGVSYDIIYVRQPRFGDNTNTTLAGGVSSGADRSGRGLDAVHPDGRRKCWWRAATAR